MQDKRDWPEQSQPRFLRRPHDTQSNSVYTVSKNPLFDRGAVPQVRACQADGCILLIGTDIRPRKIKAERQLVFISTVRSIVLWSLGLKTCAYSKRQRLKLHGANSDVKIDDKSRYEPKCELRSDEPQPVDSLIQQWVHDSQSGVKQS